MVLVEAPATAKVRECSARIMCSHGERTLAVRALWKATARTQRRHFRRGLCYDEPTARPPFEVSLPRAGPPLVPAGFRIFRDAAIG